MAAMALRYCMTPLVTRSGTWRMTPALVTSRSYGAEVESKEVARAAPQAPETHRGNLGLRDHRVNKLEKYLLVWGGKYKTVADVPDLVSQDTLERARNKARIKINIMMGAGTLFGCFLMVWLGKKDAREGKSVVKMNEEWHRRMNEEAEAKAKAKAIQEGKDS